MVLPLKLFSVCPLNRSTGITHSEANLRCRSYLQSKCLSKVLMEASLSLQTLIDREQLNESFLDTTDLIYFCLCFLNILFHWGQQMHVYMSGAIHLYNLRGPVLQSLLSFVTEWKACGLQHCYNSNTNSVATEKESGFPNDLHILFLLKSQFSLHCSFWKSCFWSLLWLRS